MIDYRKVFYSAATDNAKLAIGELCVQWGLLEAMVENCIWKVIETPYDVGRSVTATMQIQGKMDVLETILTQTNPHLGSQFSLVANYIRNCLLGSRNTYVHGMWASHPEPQGFEYVVKFNARGKLVHVGGQVTSQDIAKLASDVADTTSWIMAFSDLLPPMPKPVVGRDHKNQEKRDPQERANHKKLALQPPTAAPLK